MKKKYFYAVMSCLMFCSFLTNAQVQTISATYSAGDIPTAYNAYDPTCNGASTALTVTLPPVTGSWEVVSVDIEYDMTAANVAYMSEQRSQVKFQNTGFTEPTESGTGTGGTFSYSRSGLTFANGFYAGNTDLIFEMQAWRTWGDTAPNNGCGTHYNKVDNNSWVVTVNYQIPPTCLPPSNVQSGNATTTSVDITWVDMNAVPPGAWNIEYGAPGFALGTGTTHMATGSPTTINGLALGTDYEFYIQSDCGTVDGVSIWEGPYDFSTTIDCSVYNLDITNTVDQTIACQGTATLTATSSGTGDDIYWYDAAIGGNIVGTGSSFTTPVISTTTSYWASEIKMQSGSGGATPTYCIPTYSTGCTVGDDIDDFDMSSAGISHTGTGCSTGSYADYTNDPSLVGVMNIGSTYTFSATHNFSSQYLKIWIDLDQDGTFSASELLFTSAGGSNNTTGSITIPAANGGATVMRVMDSYASVPTDACNPGTTYGETHDYKVIISDVACESPREEVVATVDTNGDIQVTTVPYNNINDTANYGDPFEGNPGSSCGTTENYLNGNDVVYKFTAPNTELVDVLMSDLSGFYASVFIYDNCGTIGGTCLAGAIAGPSDDDFGIEDFSVTAGEDYYIVVSSWLNPTVGYTLDIIPFDCANLATPVGPVSQEFTTNDTLADLEVDPTKTGATLAWYSDAATTTLIADTTVLVDGTTYYVTQTFNGCESDPLAITVSEIDCTSFAIVSSMGDSVNCQGDMTLTATGSGTGSEIYWYDSATGGNPVSIGSSFDTPTLTNTTSYWASEVFIQGYFLNEDNGLNDWTYGFGTTSNNYGLEFDATQSFTLQSVEVFSTSASGGNLTVELLDDQDNVIQTSNFMLPSGGSDASPIPVTLSLNFQIPQAGTYRLAAADNPDLKYEADFSNNYVNYPYSLGSVGEITQAFTTFTTYDYNYYFFYNWTVVEGEFICESFPRTEVVATVNQTGDVQVDFTDLPYNTSDSTSVYGDNFDGDPGSDCPGVDYLGGNEVVYQYTADANNDDILQIELTSVTNPSTGMYIYTSCGEVGTNCLEGATNEGNSSMITISDYYINAGETIFIVISSESSTVNYTLDIYGFDCNNVAGPIVDDTTPYFVQPDTLDDIDLEESENSSGIVWYSDAGATMPIPGNTPLVDGTTYYVTQTILGCESSTIAVTPVEFNCSAMGVSQAEDVTICAPGGNTSLSAQSSGIGYDIFWYDAATGGNVVATGSNPVVNVTQTTSFWASEVYLGSGVSAGPIANTYCIPTSKNCSVGDDMDDFSMPTAGIQHTGTGCSANSYGDYTTDPSLVGNMTIGSTYNFDITHNFSNQYVKIWIDLDQSGSFDASELLFTSTSGSGNTVGSITIPSGLSGATVMRVMDRYAGTPVDACDAGGTYGETHDYKVIIGTILCESTREEVVVTINDQPTVAPSGDAIQKLCTGATVADLSATGTNIQWYSSASGNASLAPNEYLIDGEVYYASQTIDACESDNRLEVTVEVKDVADLPIASINQSFVSGETVEDIDVQGDNLIWYTSTDGLIFTMIDPSQVNLIDQGVYYVSQTPNGLCESEKLAITVHRVLGLDNPLFAGLNYYPNPMRNQVTVENSSTIERVELYSMLGQKVIDQKSNQRKLSLNVERLAAGPYFMKVTVDGKSAMIKLVKE